MNRNKTQIKSNFKHKTKAKRKIETNLKHQIDRWWRWAFNWSSSYALFPLSVTNATLFLTVKPNALVTAGTGLILAAQVHAAKPFAAALRTLKVWPGKEPLRGLG